MKSIRYFLGIFILCTCCTASFGQRIRVFFFAPTATIQANFTGPSAAYIRPSLCVGQPTGYSYVFLDGVTAGQFRASAPPRIRATYDSLTTVTSLMRKRIDQLRSLSNGLVDTVEVNLYDDRTGMPVADSCICDNMFGAIRGVWPCADNDRNATTGVYYGNLMLGELSANHIIANFPGGYWAWNETVVHEFSHTQFANEYNTAGRKIRNKWGVGGIGISYGGDAGHWGDELMADQQMALDEGLATFWGLESNRVGRDSLIAFLNSKDFRLALGSHSFLTGTPAMWNAPHDVFATGLIPANRRFPLPNGNFITLVSPHIQTGARYELRRYKWLNVPGEYVFYNEQMFQGFALLYHEFAYEKKDTAFTKILMAAKKLTPPRERLRYPATLANELANLMELYANTARGRAEETAGTLVSSMFAYAVFDIITHFGMSENDLKREFTINMSTYVPIAVPKAFNAYWAERNAIRQLVCPHLGGSNCVAGTGNIDVIRAVTEARNYLRNASKILR